MMVAYTGCRTPVLIRAHDCTACRRDIVMMENAYMGMGGPVHAQCLSRIPCLPFDVQGTERQMTISTINEHTSQARIHSTKAR